MVWGQWHYLLQHCMGKVSLSPCHFLLESSRYIFQEVHALWTTEDDLIVMPVC